MIRENINRIDFQLKNLFENVEITEKNNKVGYFEIIASSLVDVDGEKKRAQIKAFITKPALESNIVKWSYCVNPSNVTSDVIERVSNIDNVANDIYDVVKSKRMEKEYFESLQSEYELILESVEEKFEDKISSLLEKFGVNEKLIVESKFNLDGSTPEKTISIKKELKLSERFALETELRSLGIEYITFVGDVIKFKI